MKNFKVTKILAEIKFEGFLGELEAKKIFPGSIIHEILETNYSFYLK